MVFDLLGCILQILVVGVSVCTLAVRVVFLQVPAVPFDRGLVAGLGVVSPASGTG